MTDTVSGSQSETAADLAPVGNKASRLVAVGGAGVGLLAASSCAVPLVLMGLGVGGAFAGSLWSLAPYREYFAIATAIFFLGGAYLVYVRPRILRARGKACRPGRVRVSSVAVQALLWFSAASAAVAFAYPYYEDWLISIL